jgi:hypothetical protein
MRWKAVFGLVRRTLPEKPAQVVGGNVDGVGRLLDRGAAGEVLGIPGEGALDLEVGTEKSRPAQGGPAMSASARR